MSPQLQGFRGAAKGEIPQEAVTADVVIAGAQMDAGNDGAVKAIAKGLGRAIENGVAHVSDMAALAMAERVTKVFPGGRAAEDVPENARVGVKHDPIDWAETNPRLS